MNGAQLEIYPTSGRSLPHDDRGVTNLRMFCVDGGMIEGVNLDKDER